VFKEKKQLDIRGNKEYMKKKIIKCQCGGGERLEIIDFGDGQIFITISEPKGTYKNKVNKDIAEVIVDKKELDSLTKESSER
jgi:hypothetical protein